MALTIQHTILAQNGLQEVVLTPRKAIRKKCLDCCCFQPVEVNKCVSSDCPLWPYRIGTGTPQFIESKQQPATEEARFD